MGLRFFLGGEISSSDASDFTPGVEEGGVDALRFSGLTPFLPFVSVLGTAAVLVWARSKRSRMRVWTALYFVVLAEAEVIDWGR